MNLLIVGRKSKTQMRNMFYWAGIISILICLPLRVSAQSYEQMWKQVEVLEDQTKDTLDFIQFRIFCIYSLSVYDCGCGFPNKG